MREGGKKHLGKKNFEHIFGKVNEGNEIKKNDLFGKNLMRATKKTSQKNIAGKRVFFISRNKLVFFYCAALEKNLFFW